MRTEQQVTAAFLDGLGAELRSRLTGWEAALPELLGAARRAWPDFAVDAGDFLRWLLERLPAAGPQGAEALKAADLYLAFACARGDAAALRGFERHCVPELEAALARLRLSRVEQDELLQELRQKLLVSENGAEPRIGLYGGKGELRRWVRSVATREGLVRLRTHTPEVGMEQEFFDAFPSAAEDVELQHARREYQVEFKRAFEDALRSLQPAERNLLRRHFIDGLTTPQLAALQGVHRVTLFRRLRQTCDALVERTRQRLLERLPVTERELASLDRLIRSHLDVSLERLLPPE
ncbi:sigma-70 family RNA polymerase sigma factor [Corallococcus exercitus]|uniref:Sigma-70 family RNA polymerase sigma factor n=1 Tax=Corallococcus exercitus TaxID=2316736 RepID=A0A7Y4KMI7_9BACT|nr:sigma-70 family RNA polymerase sigma factor [Corallococcus exercitus]